MGLFFTITLLLAIYWFFRSPLPAAIADSMRQNAGAVGDRSAAEAVARLHEEVSGLREEMMELAERMDFNDRVLADLGRVDRGRPILFAKQMAHHLLGIDYQRLAASINFLLIRDPVEMLPSLDKVIPEPGLGDTGLDRQVELFEALLDQGQVLSLCSLPQLGVPQGGDHRPGEGVRIGGMDQQAILSIPDPLSQ